MHIHIGGHFLGESLQRFHGREAAKPSLLASRHMTSRDRRKGGERLVVCWRRGWGGGVIIMAGRRKAEKKGGEITIRRGRRRDDIISARRDDSGTAIRTPQKLSRRSLSLFSRRGEHHNTA